MRPEVGKIVRRLEEGVHSSGGEELRRQLAEHQANRCEGQRCLPAVSDLRWRMRKKKRLVPDMVRAKMNVLYLCRLSKSAVMGVSCMFSAG